MQTLNCSGGAIVGEYIFYNDVFLSSICKMSIPTHNAEIIHKTGKKYETVVKTQKEIAFFEETLEDILFIDINSAEIWHIYVKNGESFRVSRVFTTKGGLLVVPINPDRGLIMIDCVDHTYVEHPSLNSFEELIEIQNVNYPYLIDAVLVFPDYGENRYYELDCHSMKVIKHVVHDKIRFSSVCKKNGYTYATQMDKKGILMIDDDRVVNSDLFENDCSFQQPFSCFSDMKDILVVLPSLSNEFCLIGKDFKKRLPIPNNCSEGMASKSLGCDIHNGKLWIYPYRRGGAFYCYDLETFSMEKIVPNYTDDEVNEEIFSKHIMEQEAADLSALILYLLDDQNVSGEGQE